MYTESPPLNGANPEHDADARERTSSHRPHRPRPSGFRPSSGLRYAPAGRGTPSTIKRIIRGVGRFLIAIVMGLVGTLAWQSYGAQIVRAWAPSLGWLLPASPTAELQAQVKPVALDLAIVRRSIDQLGSNQDQLARKQDQMTQAMATLEAAVRDISQNILALAPLAPKAAHALPPKSPQSQAQ